jgi:hypothetical protein
VNLASAQNTLERIRALNQFSPTLMPQNAPQANPLEFAPASLKNMLLREAALALARQRLAKAIPVAQAHEQEVRATRAPFMIMLPTKANQEIRANLEGSRQTLEVLQKALIKLEALESQLLPLVSYRLETHLRRCAKDYINGLAGNRYPDDWARIQTRLEDCIRTYHDSLKELAHLCTTLPPGTIIGTNPPGRQLANRAITWGGCLESEIQFINRVADSQRAQNGPGGFTLNRQPAVNWKESAQSLLDIDAATAAAALHNLVSQSELITKQIIIAISAEKQLSLHHPDHGASQYHAEQWASLREAALLAVNPADLESLAKDTEVLLSNGEFEAWSRIDDAPPEISPPPAARTPSTPPFPVTAPPFAKPIPSSGPKLKIPSRTLPPFLPPKP